jgi:hypothetical protein
MMLPTNIKEILGDKSLQDKNFREIEVSHSDLLNISESRNVPKE